LERPHPGNFGRAQVSFLFFSFLRLLPFFFPIEIRVKVEVLLGTRHLHGYFTLPEDAKYLFLLHDCIEHQSTMPLRQKDDDSRTPLEP
jgi:hypothetical protein